MEPIERMNRQNNNRLKVDRKEEERTNLATRKGDSEKGRDSGMWEWKITLARVVTKWWAHNGRRLHRCAMVITINHQNASASLFFFSLNDLITGEKDRGSVICHLASSPHLLHFPYFSFRFPLLHQSERTRTLLVSGKAASIQQRWRRWQPTNE